MESTFEILSSLKALFAVVGAILLALATTSCGFTSPNGYTIGSTSYLEAQMEGQRRILIEKASAAHSRDFDRKKSQSAGYHVRVATDK